MVRGYITVPPKRRPAVPRNIKRAELYATTAARTSVAERLSAAG
jgi:hypothetical protein